MIFKKIFSICKDTNFSPINKNLSPSYNFDDSDPMTDYFCTNFYLTLSYSSAKTAQKRMDKLEKAGIRCKLTGYNGGYIEFLGYTPETEALLEKERQEVIIAHQAWQAKQVQTA